MDEGVSLTEAELLLARTCVMEPGYFKVTEPELRACRAIVAWRNEGIAVSEDDMGLARRLFEALRSGRWRA